IGIAWLVIVAAEMLVGGTGIGYFVWNEWNNLSITNVIAAILVIGVIGMVLDQILARATRLGTFPEGGWQRRPLCTALSYPHKRGSIFQSGRLWVPATGSPRRIARHRRA